MTLAYIYGGDRDGQLIEIDAELRDEIDRSFRMGQYIDTGYRVGNVMIVGLYTIVPFPQIRAKVLTLLAQQIISQTQSTRFCRYVHESQAIIVAQGSDTSVLLRRLPPHKDPPSDLAAFLAQPRGYFKSNPGYLLAQWWSACDELCTVSGIVSISEPVNSIRDFASRFEERMSEVGVCPDQSRWWSGLPR